MLRVQFPVQRLVKVIPPLPYGCQTFSVTVMNSAWTNVIFVAGEIISAHTEKMQGLFVRKVGIET